MGSTAQGAAVRLVEDATIRRASMDRVGKVLADTYRIESLIAEGGMGSVYACEHVRLQQRFAVKFLETAGARDSEAYARFRQEAEIAASLNHRSILQVFDFNTDADGNPYLVMELVEGATLTEYIQGRQLPVRDVIRILEPIASGLDAAHRAGIVHRDLKPSNIIVRRLPSGAFSAKLLDFGISKVRDVESAMTSDNIVMGSPNYMSPEQAKGFASTADARTDIFALGAILYEMLTGKRAFDGRETPKLLHAIVYDHPPSILTLREDCPPALSRVVLRCLSKDARDRYSSVRALVQAVQEILRTEDARRKPDVPDIPPPPPPRKRSSAAPWVAGWAVSVILTGAVAGIAGTRFAAVSPVESPPETIVAPKPKKPAKAIDPRTFDPALATIGARMLSVGHSLYRADGRGLTLWAEADAPPKFRPLPSPTAVTVLVRSLEGDVLVGQADGSVTRWDRDLEQTTWQRRLGEESIVGLAADGDYLAAASGSRVGLFNTRTGRILRSFDGEHGVVALAMTRGPKSVLLIVRSRSIELIDADARRSIGALPLDDTALRATLSDRQAGHPPELLIDFRQGEWLVRRPCRISFKGADRTPRFDFGTANRL